MSAAQERRARAREREIVDPVDAWPMRQKSLALSTSKIEMGNPTCRVRLASHTKQSEHASGTKTTAPVAEAVSDDGRRRCTSSGPNKKGSEEQPFCSPDANCDPGAPDHKANFLEGTQTALALALTRSGRHVRYQYLPVFQRGCTGPVRDKR